MKIQGRFGLSCLAATLLGSPCIPVASAVTPLMGNPADSGNSGSAAPADDPVATITALTDMETQAAQAEPRERCFLYTELLHEWTELAGRSLAAGDTTSAANAIEHADANAARLKVTISRDSKRLKNAELLMERSVHRLSDIVRASTLEQRDSMQAMLHRVTSVHDDLLAAVFAH